MLRALGSGIWLLRIQSALNDQKPEETLSQLCEGHHEVPDKHVTTPDLKDLLVHSCLECSTLSNYSLPFPERITSPACCLSSPRRQHTPPAPGDIRPGHVTLWPMTSEQGRPGSHLSSGSKSRHVAPPPPGDRCTWVGPDPSKQEPSLRSGKPP